MISIDSSKYCYKQLLKEYILINADYSSLQNIYSKNYLDTLSINSLEKLVASFNKNYPMFSAFIAGLAVANYKQKNINPIDLDALEIFQELIGIFCPS